MGGDRNIASDIRYMQHALRLARRGLGSVHPNPAVGCVIVKDGRVAGCGVTARGGRPHAETVALEQAGEKAAGATIYVTLEPCCHHGKTPPCSDAIIAAAPARVVVACQDPNPKMQGRGIGRIEQAGITVTTGVCEQEARALNAGFFLLQTQDRPLVSVKIATSLDGKITGGNTENRWLTGKPARDFGHLLRANHDAILTGIGTVLADDPQLTCRLAALEDRSPVRVILDGRLRLPESSLLLQTIDKAPLWLITRNDTLQNEQAKALDLQQRGIRVFSCNIDDTGGLSLPEILQLLGAQGITRLLVEGGAQVTQSFINNKLVDRLYWFRAPLLVGAAGKCIMDKTVIANSGEIPQFRRVDLRPLGEDVLEIYEVGEKRNWEIGKSGK